MLREGGSTESYVSPSLGAGESDPGLFRFFNPCKRERIFILVYIKRERERERERKRKRERVREREREKSCCRPNLPPHVYLPPHLEVI